MNTTSLRLVLALSLCAPASALLPSSSGSSLPAAQAAALHARFDPSLGSLRAGRGAAPTALAAHERAELAAAQQHSSSLASLRAGFEPSDNEWMWLAIGAAIVIVIILL